MAPGGEKFPDDVVCVWIHLFVLVIPERAFVGHKKLKEVEFSKGMHKIGGWSFCNCIALTTIITPTSLIVICKAAFVCCTALTMVKLSNGLLHIGDFSFNSCGFDQITIPDTTRTIGRFAFARSNLSSLRLHDEIESIRSYALCNCQFANFRLLPLITRIAGGMVVSCKRMFAVEIPENTIQIEEFLLQGCHSLQNIALSTNTDVASTLQGVFLYCTALLQLFNAEFAIKDALKSRFDELPIHRMFYYQSYHPITLEELRNSCRQWDCLGMTLLNILTCSTVHHLKLYEFMINKCPKNLITEDKWGVLPLLYILRGNTPREIVLLLVRSYQSL